MSVEATIYVWKLSKKQITSTEKLILLSYADRADEYGEAYPSVKRLMLDTLLDRKTIIKALQSICEKGIMSKTGEFRGNTKQVPVYKFISLSFREDAYEESNVLNENDLNSPKNGTGPKNGTSTKIGMGTSPKNGTGTSPKFGTRNLPLNLPI